MGVTFTLPHVIDVTHRAGWLWYSHDATNPPRDRQVVSGNGIIRPPGIHSMASWYFLSDQALQVIHPSDYLLTTIQYGEWRLWIKDPGRAAMFKLRWL